MELEVEVQKMFESFPRNFTDGALTDARKDCIQEFREKGCSNSCRAIWNDTKN